MRRSLEQRRVLPPPRRVARFAVAGCAAVLAGLHVLPSLACRDAALGLGATPPEARATAHELFEALAVRFGPHELNPALRELRPKLSRAAMNPSWIFDDESAPLERAGPVRLVTFAGERGERGRYRLGLRPGAPPARRAGQYRGRLRLERLGRDEYEWSMREELAVGALRAAHAARALTAVLAGIEAAPQARAAAALSSALPHTGGALGRAFAIHALHLRPHPAGGAVALLDARLRTDRLAAAGFAAYARFLDQHVSRMRLRVTVAAPDGTRFWELDLHDGRLLVTLRSLGGSLAPLSGATRPMPAALAVQLAFSVPSGPWRVGFEGLEAEARLVRAPREKGFSLSFRGEPSWRLPFALRPFLRASLRRPFEGPGASLAYALREQDQGSTLLVREYRVAVRESWLVRWLGGLSSRAAEAFRSDAEEQADRFAFEALDALRRDALALAGP